MDRKTLGREIVILQTDLTLPVRKCEKKLEICPTRKYPNTTECSQ